MPEHNWEQFMKLYKKLPQEIKDVVFAEETGENISRICEKNSLEKEMLLIVDLVGKVLLGLLPPEEFQATLEQELEIEKEIARRVAHEINRFVFFPVKESLATLYISQKETAPATEVPLKRPMERPTEAVPETKKTTLKTKTISKTKKAESPRKPRATDVYREPIE